MKVIIETKSGRQWMFNSMEAAKAAGSLKSRIRIKDADRIIKKDGERIAVYK
jgi:hypothetical protein